MQAGEASASVGEALAESQPVHGEEEREEGTITLPTLDPQAAQRCAAVEQKICCRREGNLVAAQAKAVARSRWASLVYSHALLRICSYLHLTEQLLSGPNRICTI